jgi:hypothetical protein
MIGYKQRTAKDKVVAKQLMEKNDKEDKKNFVIMKKRKMNIQTQNLQSAMFDSSTSSASTSTSNDAVKYEAASLPNAAVNAVNNDTMDLDADSNDANEEGEDMNTVREKYTDDDDPEPNVPRVSGGEQTTAKPRRKPHLPAKTSSVPIYDGPNDTTEVGDETNEVEDILLGDGQQTEGIVGLTQQEISTRILHNFVDDIMKKMCPGVTRQTASSRVALPIVKTCGNPVAIENVTHNDVLFGGMHDQCLSRHHGNRPMYELVRDELIRKPTTSAHEDRRDDITTIINTLVANGARFLHSDNENECFVPMSMGKVRVKFSSMFNFAMGLESMKTHIESCENYHKQICISKHVKGGFQVSIILIYSFFYTLTYQI